jgi:hypothetical protein
LLAREGNNAGAANQLKALVQAVERQEPRNPALWLHLAQPFARLAGQAVNTAVQDIAMLQQVAQEGLLVLPLQLSKGFLYASVLALLCITSGFCMLFPLEMHMCVQTDAKVQKAMLQQVTA